MNRRANSPWQMPEDIDWFEVFALVVGGALLVAYIYGFLWILMAFAVMVA